MNMKKIRYSIFFTIISITVFGQTNRPPKFDVSGLIVSNEFQAELNHKLDVHAMHFYTKDLNPDLQLPAVDAIDFNILKLNAKKISAALILTPINKADGSLNKNREWLIGASYLHGLNFYSAQSKTIPAGDTTFVDLWYNGFNCNEFDVNTSYLFKTNTDYTAGFYCGVDASLGVTIKSGITSFYGKYWETDQNLIRGLISQTKTLVDAKHCGVVKVGIPMGLRFDIVKHFEFHAMQEFSAGLFLFDHSLTIPSFNYSAGIGLQYNF